MTILLNLQITRSDIRPHIKWAVSLVIAYIWALQYSLVVCAGVYGLTYSLYHPRGGYSYESWPSASACWWLLLTSNIDRKTMQPKFNPTVFTSSPFLKNSKRHCFGFRHHLHSLHHLWQCLLYILVAFKASFLKFNMCNVCKNNITKVFLVFFSKFKVVNLVELFVTFCKKSFAQILKKPLGRFSQNLKCRYI